MAAWPGKRSRRASLRRVVLRLEIDDLPRDEMQYAQAGGRTLPGESGSFSLIS